MQYIRTKVPELLNLEFGSVDPLDQEASLRFKAITSSTIRTIEGLSLADKGRVFTHSIGLKSNEVLPDSFFILRHKIVGNVPRNFTNRLSQLMDEASGRWPGVKKGLMLYNTKLPVLLVEAEAGGYSAVSVILALYGFPHPDRLAEGGTIKRDAGPSLATSAGQVQTSSPFVMKGAVSGQQVPQVQAHGASLTGQQVAGMPSHLGQRASYQDVAWGSAPTPGVGPKLIMTGLSADDRRRLNMRMNNEIPEWMMNSLSSITPDSRTGDQVAQVMINFYNEEVRRSEACEYYAMLLMSSSGGLRPSNQFELLKEFEKCLDMIENLARGQTSFRFHEAAEMGSLYQEKSFESSFGYDASAMETRGGVESIFESAFGAPSSHASYGSARAAQQSGHAFDTRGSHMLGEKRHMAEETGLSQVRKSAKLGIGHPELSAHAASSSQAANMSPIGAGAFGAVSSQESTAMLERSMAVFAAERSTSNIPDLRTILLSSDHHSHAFAQPVHAEVLTKYFRCSYLPRGVGTTPHEIRRCRIRTAHERHPCIMANYAFSHELPEHVLREGGLIGTFILNEGQIRWLAQVELALLFGVRSTCHIPMDAKAAYHMLGNAIAIPHAILCLLNGIAQLECIKWTQIPIWLLQDALGSRFTKDNISVQECTSTQALIILRQEVSPTQSWESQAQSFHTLRVHHEHGHTSFKLGSDVSVLDFLRSVFRLPTNAVAVWKPRGDADVKLPLFAADTAPKDGMLIENLWLGPMILTEKLFEDHSSTIIIAFTPGGLFAVRRASRHSRISKGPCKHRTI